MAMFGEDPMMFGPGPDMMGRAYQSDPAVRAAQSAAMDERLRALYRMSPIPALLRMVTDPLASFGGMAERGLEGHYAALSGTEAETGRPLLGLERAAELINTLPGVVPGGGTVLGAGPVMRRAAKEAAEETGEQAARRGIRAYHGSPHDFERFDISRIGTGEGAQAYGHGLYFAESPGTAKGYRDALAGRATYEIREFKRKVGFDDAWTTAVKDMQKSGMGDDEIRGALRQAYGLNDDQINIAVHEANPGRMYEVSIKADPEDFLDWDKPLNKQSEEVQQRLIDAGMISKDDLEPAIYTPGGSLVLTKRNVSDLGASWDDAVRKADEAGNIVSTRADQQLGGVRGITAASTIGMGEDAAQRLREAGIPGIRYLDQGSRAAGEGTRNYVIFSDDIIEILRKYGIAGLVGGGGAAALGAGDAQAQE